MQRARLAQKRRPGLGEVSALCFYATKLRFRDLAFDIGANHGGHTAQMLARGARVVAVEPQADLAADLSRRFPSATVVSQAVSDHAGEAELHIARDLDAVASLDEGWVTACAVSFTWERTEKVAVTSLDALIAEHGEPKLIKIDTEGLDHRVLLGLSRPVAHILFEINPGPSARVAFERLDELGAYEYRAAPQIGSESWMFGKPLKPDEIVNDLEMMCNVYARRLDS